MIETAATPNPHALKFLLGRPVLAAEAGARSPRPANFDDVSAAAASPLATRLLAIEGLSGVLLGPDFVTVRKREDTCWAELRGRAAAEIEAWLASDEPALLGPEAMPSAAGDDLEEAVLELLETRIRPAVVADGGDVL